MWSEYAGENFVRFTGDTQKHAVAQLFAWEAHEKGVDVHLLAEPTKLEILQKEYDKKKEQFKSQVRNVHVFLFFFLNSYSNKKFSRLKNLFWKNMVEKYI